MAIDSSRLPGLPNISPSSATVVSAASTGTERASLLLRQPEHVLGGSLARPGRFVHVDRPDLVGDADLAQQLAATRRRRCQQDERRRHARVEADVGTVASMRRSATSELLISPGPQASRSHPGWRSGMSSAMSGKWTVDLSWVADGFDVQYYQKLLDRAWREDPIFAPGSSQGRCKAQVSSI